MLHSGRNNHGPLVVFFTMECTSALVKWWQSRQNLDSAPTDLQMLLGSFWKSQWNRIVSPEQQATNPIEALLLVCEWAESISGFPLPWLEMLRLATHDPVQLLPKASQVLELCENGPLCQMTLAALPAPVSGKSPGSGEGPLFRDYRGIACPLNSVRARIELDRMPPGSLVHLLLDNGSPIENVPGALTADGHRILNRVRHGGYWELHVERRPR